MVSKLISYTITCRKSSILTSYPKLLFLCQISININYAWWLRQMNINSSASWGFHYPLLAFEHCDSHLLSLFLSSTLVISGGDGCEVKGFDQAICVDLVSVDNSAQQSSTHLAGSTSTMAQQGLRQAKSGKSGCTGLSDASPFVPQLMTQQTKGRNGFCNTINNLVIK